MQQQGGVLAAEENGVAAAVGEESYPRIGLSLVSFEIERQFAVGREYSAWCSGGTGRLSRTRRHRIRTEESVAGRTNRKYRKARYTEHVESTFHRSPPHRGLKAARHPKVNSRRVPYSDCTPLLGAISREATAYCLNFYC